MRLSVKLTAEDGGYVLTLLPAQRVAVAYAVDGVATLSVPDPVLEVMFGAPRQTLVEAGKRVDSEEPVAVTPAELRAVYQMLRTLPECYASEEAFHTRTGYYRESFTGLAKAILEAVGRVSGA